MLRPLRSLLGRRGPETPAAPAAPDLPRPASTTYVVGDLHGRADLLELMLELIDGHIGGTGSADPQLVFVGDLVDHGPDSAGVVARLQELTRDFPDNVTCLMGNHERMMLDVLNDPVARGPRWLREGGGATLASYGIPTGALEAAAPARAWREMAAGLDAALGPDTRDWLESRPLSWRSGNLWAVHAGADPARPMAEQTARVLLWGHPEFGSAPRGDDAWVAHGHVVLEAPVFAEGRIGVDTGAWSTGRLTAVAIRPDGGHAFLQT
ncbi:metallophosphoesterase [Roseicyclus persicicus]|uniref:Serine/threonine protein phosphatase n=1 Tax=Roseicyclus persicicus TaxID=2650661 RepID=A0A7X6H1K1_9RHOB|nr:metallophosphoesterase [Roseibacterium persicicum]NKX45458.1 serine/threonine protein phosphatase [Roseibacterium persicicum]